MNRLKLLKSDGYWEEAINNKLYHKNYKGKNRRKKLIQEIIDIKNELINNLMCENEKK